MPYSDINMINRHSWKKIFPWNWKSLAPGEIKFETAAILESKARAQSPLQIETSPTFVKNLRYFAENFGVPRTVVYPCCNVDASPKEAFPTSQITFLDIEPNCAAAFRKNGIEILLMDAVDYRPSPGHDLLLIFNPQMHSSDLTHLAKKGGLILANNYHGNTSQLLERPDQYQFLGMIHYANASSLERTLVDMDTARGILQKHTDYPVIFRKL